MEKNSSKKSKSDIKNIVTLDAYTDKKYIFKGDKLEPLKRLSFNKANFITSYVSNKDIITATVHVSRSIPEEDIPDIKAYEDFGLDQVTNYMISYEEVNIHEEEREFHILLHNLKHWNPYSFLLRTKPNFLI